MRIKFIKFKNIGSYGNKLQELSFDDEGSLIVVQGKVGYGKSTLLNLYKLLCYGKLDKTKKENIPNRINKNGWIYGEGVMGDGSVYAIERCFAPNKLTVYKDGVDITKTGVKDSQSYIEEDIIGIPYNIFNNVVSLSINDFKSFLTMTPSDKRNIVDKIFSTEIINKLHELVKRDVRDVKYNLDSFEREMVVIDGMLKRINDEIEQVEDIKAKDDIVKAEELKQKVQALMEKRAKVEERHSELVVKHTQAQRNVNLIRVKEGNIDAEIAHIQTKINLFCDNECCPTCSTPFIDTERMNYSAIQESLRKQLEDKKTNKKTLKDIETKYVNASKGIAETKNKLLAATQMLSAAINDTNRKLASHNTNASIAKDVDGDSLKKISRDHKKRINDLITQKTETDKMSEILDVMERMYSDEGVKRLILEQFIPSLNVDISIILKELRFPYELAFDFDFKPFLSFYGDEIDIDTLSTGEHKKVDIAVLISIIKMIKSKFPFLNIFSLDELLSSIDPESSVDILGILKQVTKTLSIHMLIVSHTSLPIECFDTIVSLNKVDGFSDLVVVKNETE